jgi:hypothetical protein
MNGKWMDVALALGLLVVILVVVGILACATLLPFLLFFCCVNAIQLLCDYIT